MERCCDACGRTWKIRLRKCSPGMRYVDYMRADGNVKEVQGESDAGETGKA